VRSQERIRSLLHSPQLMWNVLVRGRYRFVYDMMPITLSEMSIEKRVNLFKAGSNLVYRRLSPVNMPLHIQIELTNYCNLRCPVCPTGIRAVDRRAKAIEVDLFQQLMDEVGPYLLTISLWAWGEPLLHPQLKEILHTARRHHMATLLSTNGQNLDHEEVIEALLEEPPTCLIVAIDGLTDATNSMYRVGAKLEPILAGVRRLAELKKQLNVRLPILHMRYIVMKHNEHELPDLETFARDNHFDFLTIRTLSIIDSKEPDRMHQDFVPETHEWRAYGYTDQGRDHRSDFICQQPFWFPTVFADGTLVACEQDFNAQQSLGVVSKDVSFADLWFGQRAAEVRKTIRDDSQTLSFCRNCPFCDRPVTDVSIQAHALSRDAESFNSLSRVVV